MSRFLDRVMARSASLQLARLQGRIEYFDEQDARERDYNEMIARDCANRDEALKEEEEI